MRDREGGEREGVDGKRQRGGRERGGKDRERGRGERQRGKERETESEGIRESWGEGGGGAERRSIHQVVGTLQG